MIHTLPALSGQNTVLLHRGGSRKIRRERDQIGRAPTVVKHERGVAEVIDKPLCEDGYHGHLNEKAEVRALVKVQRTEVITRSAPAGRIPQIANVKKSNPSILAIETLAIATKIDVMSPHNATPKFSAKRFISSPPVWF